MSQQEKNTVFLLWSGYDEERQCVGAFSSQEVAAGYAKTNSKLIENCDIEQLIVDIHIPPAPGMVPYMCYSANLDSDEVGTIAKIEDGVRPECIPGKVVLASGAKRKVHLWAANITHAAIEASGLFKECVDKEAAAHQKFYGGRS